MENIEIKIKTFIVFIMLIFIAFIGFLFFGIIRVEAKSYTFTTTPAIRITSGQTANNGTLIRCDNTYQCWYSDTGNMVGNYAQYQYGVVSSNNSSDTSYEQASYILSFRARIIALDSLDKNNLIFRLYYYPDSSNGYGRAYCDGGESYKITYNNNSDNDVYVDYTCNNFQITSNVTFFVISIGSTPNTIFGTQVSQNLKLIGPGEATNKDVIDSITDSTTTIVENNNSNTDKITNNQDKNTDKITDSVDKNTEVQQETNDFLKDDSSANLSAFNDYAGWLPPGPLDSILNLPLTLLNNLTNLFSSSCQGITIPLPYLDKNLELPCVNTIYDKIEGLNVVINTLCIPLIGYILFKYFMNLYNWVDKTLTFRENNYIDNWGGV